MAPKILFKFIASDKTLCAVGDIDGKVLVKSKSGNLNYDKLRSGITPLTFVEDNTLHLFFGHWMLSCGRDKIAAIENNNDINTILSRNNACVVNSDETNYYVIYKSKRYIVRTSKDNTITTFECSANVEAHKFTAGWDRVVSNVGSNEYYLNKDALYRRVQSDPIFADDIVSHEAYTAGTLSVELEKFVVDTKTEAEDNVFNYMGISGDDDAAFDFGNSIDDTPPKSLVVHKEHTSAQIMGEIVSVRIKLSEISLQLSRLEEAFIESIKKGLP